MEIIMTLEKVINVKNIKRLKGGKR